MIKLSKRLRALSDLVTEGCVLADIGTDHGYLPIYLVLTGKIKRAFAMDIGTGPLMHAKEHIEAYGLGDYITLRRSDGAAALHPGEADSVLIAGMGGGVMLHILEDGEETLLSAKEWILQPQSEIQNVREYLYRKGYCIDREDMVLEDGKYYPMMHVSVGHTAQAHGYKKEEFALYCRYGEKLLRSGNTVLTQYLQHQILQYESVLLHLEKQRKEAARVRRKEIETELGYAKAALDYGKEV